MGVVYRARDTKLDREVALKILPPEVAAIAERRQRFAREVKAIAALNHPHIVTIHAVEATADHRFYTMELVDGPSLGELMHKHGLPLTRFFELALALTDAVDYAHNHGITHRDLKPANIVIDAEGRLKVLDFGLAKLKVLAGDSEAETVSVEDSITGEGRIVGTVNCMSPEQAEGKPVDHRSDIFSLGIVLYEMATGRRPFQGDTPISTVSSIIKDTPISITELNRSLPRHLGRIVTRCLAKDQNRRYQSARDLHNDLLDLREEIDSGSLVSPAYRMTGGRRRFRVWQLVAGSGLVVVAAVLAVNHFLPGAGNPDRVPFEAARTMEITSLTQSGDVTQASLSPDGKYLAYIRTDGRQRSLRLKQIATGSDQELVPPGEGLITDPRISPDGNFIYYHVSDDGGSIHRVPLLGGRSRRIISDADERFALSPDGRTIAFNRWSMMDRKVMLANVDGSETWNLVTYSILTSHELAISPDGLEIATGKMSHEGIGEIIVAVPLAGGPERTFSDQIWGTVTGSVWLPDGSGMLIAGARGLTQYHDPTQIWLLHDDGELLQLTSDLNSYGSLSLAQHGRMLAAVQTRSDISVCMASVADADRIERIAHTSNAGHYWDQVSWTPDGRVLYEGPHGGAVHIWEANPDGSDAQRVTTAGTVNLAAEVSRDGKHIVYFSNRTGSDRIWIAERDGGNPRLLAEGGCDELWPQFTPDGRWVYYLAFYPADNVITWRKVPVAGGPSSPVADFFAFDWAFSPDGERLAFVTDSLHDAMELRIMTADLSETIASYECDYYWPSILRWLPDGSGVAYTVQTEDSRNIWIHPVDGSPARQLTHRTGGAVMGFDFSPSGDSLGYSWKASTSDVVLLENFWDPGRNH